ncbi:2-oxoglutarate dehydrogenase E1 component, partial [Kickxella alabastrina]
MGRKGAASNHRNRKDNSESNDRKGKRLVRNNHNHSHSHTYDTDDFSSLNRQLKQNGLYCKDIAGDGNCLFRSLADQVDGTPDTHQRHRSAVCDYMERHPDEFAPFMDESQDFPSYLRNMRQLSVYGGNLELVAFARNYRVDIKVYQMGGTVFVISGAPAGDPLDSRRSMPTVHIAYHSYEHYSSVRNSRGPHTGLPEVKERDNEFLSFVPLLEHDPRALKHRKIGRVDATFMVMPNAVMPEAVAPTPANAAAPRNCSAKNNSNTNANDADDDDNGHSIPTESEKIAMSSTAVANHRLVRRLLREHRQNTGQVIELLVQWMADDSADDSWFLADGPPDYCGDEKEEVSKED